MFQDDRDGFDEFIPEELKSWFESQQSNLAHRHYILVNGKLKKATFLEWCNWFSVFENRIIDRTDISNEPNYPGGDFISTVFLGMNYNFDPNRPPMCFESMVFGGKYSQASWRYSSMGEAKQGHWQMVDCIRAGLPPQVTSGEKPWMELFLDMFKEDEENEEGKN